MPPINQTGSRVALTAGMVIAMIVAVTSIILTIHFYGLSKQKEVDIAALQESYAPIVALAQTKGPAATTFAVYRTDEPQRFSISTTDTLIDTALKQIGFLDAAISGQSQETTSPGTVLKNAEATVARDQKTLTDSKAGVTLLPNNLTGNIDALTTKISSLQRQVLADAAQARDANQLLVKAKADMANFGTQRDAADVKLRADNAAQVAQLQKSADDSNAKYDADTKTVAAAAADTKTMVDKALADVAAANGKIADLEKQRTALAAVVGVFRNDTANSIIQQVDGRIVRVPGNGVCYIDLGSSDHVTKGLTFEVYGVDTGVPKIPPATTGDDQLPVGKASIEITEVGTTSSECRIVKTTPGAVLAEGDLLVNLIYDRNTKYKVYVFGQFDLAHTGRPNSADAEVIKRLVTQWGGQLVDKVSVDTDFVVLGAEPTLPNFNKADMTPEESAKMQAAQDAIDKYQEVRAEATHDSVPVLNQNRFLYYVGYYDQARR